MAAKKKSTRSKNTSAKRERDGATDYAKAVVAGRIVVGPLVRLACARHLADLKIGKRRGLVWDRAAAERVIKFFADVLRLAEGEHAGKPFILQPWQQFIAGSLFGWKVQDGTRRFRTAYIEIGKGNGKTPFAAGVGLYGLVADREPAAEVYSAAVAKDQAKICFRDAERMVEASDKLSSRIVSTVNNLAFLQLGSYFRPVSSEHRGLDGKRVHIALVDELHEHPNAMVVDKMRAGTKGRRQALIVEITNSGYDRNSICYQHHDYSQKVLEGVTPNDSWFAYVCSLDEGDDWRDERVWRKANPNLGVSIHPIYLREQVAEAEGMPSKQNIVRRLNFCEWTEQATRWIDLDVWDSCPTTANAEDLRGRRCFMGVDLATVTDIAAVVLVFAPLEETEPWKLLPFFFVPKENVRRRVERDRVPYDVWIRDGLIEATEGNAIDHGFIKDRIAELAGTFDVVEVGFDPFNAHMLVTELQQDGLEMVPVAQRMSALSAPMKELEKLLLSRMIDHGGNAVLRWMASNVSARTDAAGNLMPDKERSSEKIDGIVATIVGLSRALVDVGNGRSVYETRGLEAL